MALPETTPAPAVICIQEVYGVNRFIRAITDYITDRLLPRLRPHLADLVSGLGLSDANVRAPIALEEENERQEVARAYENRSKA